MRVLLLTETFLPEIGGGERQAQLLSQALTKRGHSVTIVTRRSSQELAREQLHDGVLVIRIGPAGRGRWKKWGLVISALPLLTKLRSQTDVVLVSGYRILGLPAVLAGRMFGWKCVFKADSPGEMSGEFFRAGLAGLHMQPSSAPVRLALATRNRLLRHADAFVAISNEIATELRANGVPAECTYEVPNGVDTGRFRPASSAERMALQRRLRLPNGPLAIYTGRLVTYKGLPLLLRVWCELRRSGTPGTLVMVGTGSADIHNCENQLHEYVESHGLNDSVVFTGAVDNVHDYLRASDVFVFPTEKEAFGASLIEAMACGLPSVATRVGGIPDYFEDGDNGIMVDPSCFEQLREGIATLLAGGEQVAALGRSARQTVIARFSHDIVADEYLRVFDSVVGRCASA